MQSLYLLIPVAIVFLIFALRFLFWAVKSGQYDDLNTEGHRILFEDDASDKVTKTNKTAANAADDSKNLTPP